MNVDETVAVVETQGKILSFDRETLYETGVQWLNTIILTVLLAKFLYKPVKKFMDERSERIKNQLSGAKEAEKSAISMRDDYTIKLRDIEAERVEILEAAAKRAREKTEQLMTEAQSDAEHIRQRAYKEIALETEKVKDDIRHELIELSTALAGRFAAVSLDRSTQDKLIDDTISEAGGVTWLR
ncbi:MAG: F0F1 ATP synthase subunit B [Clostridiales bacterium]|nr:F0F1 ATP synthase subunit B [Clostridiales bacterium]